jgi:intein/homing endonuclease
LANDLINLGFGENKTYSELKIPNIPKNLIRHFIRGYFDGDGSFIGTVRPPNPKNREINPKITRSFQICGKTLTLLNEISDFLKESGINMKVNYLKRDNMYRIHTGARLEVEKVFNLLYSDANFFLKRKFTKFNYYVNTEVSQIITDHRNA